MDLNKASLCGLHLDVVEVERTGGGGAQPQLVLLLPDLHPLRVAVHHEARDAPVALQGEEEHAADWSKGDDILIDR